MTEQVVFILLFLSSVRFISCALSNDESCSFSCDKSFSEQGKALVCKHGCYLYNLIHLVAPAAGSINQNMTAESCVLACRETDEWEYLQDACTVGCTLQRIFVVKSARKLGEPVASEFFAAEKASLVPADIIGQFEEVNNKLRFFADQFVQDLLEDATEQADGTENSAILRISGDSKQPSYASLSVRTYTVENDGKVTIVDELDQQYSFVYSCFSLQFDRTLKQRIKQLLVEPMEKLKYFFSNSFVARSLPAISHTIDIELASDSNSQLSGAIQIDIVARKRYSKWYFCVAAHQSRWHYIILLLLAFSCICMLYTCWFGPNSSDSSQGLTDELCGHAENDFDCKSESAVAPPLYSRVTVDSFFPVGDQEKSSTCLNDSTLLSVEVPSAEQPIEELQAELHAEEDVRPVSRAVLSAV